MYPPSFPGGYISLLLLQSDGHLVDLAREFAAFPGIILGYRCFRINTNASSLVGREDRKLGGRDLDGANSLAVDVQGRGSACARFVAAVVGKIHLHGALALGQLGSCRDVGNIDADIVTNKYKIHPTCAIRGT